MTVIDLIKYLKKEELEYLKKVFGIEEEEVEKRAEPFNYTSYGAGGEDTKKASCEDDIPEVEYVKPFDITGDVELYLVKAFGVLEKDITVTTNKEQTEIYVKGFSSVIGRCEGELETVESRNTGKVDKTILLNPNKKYTELDYWFSGGYVFVQLTTEYVPKNKIKINVPDQL